MIVACSRVAVVLLFGAAVLHVPLHQALDGHEHPACEADNGHFHVPCEDVEHEDCRGCAAGTAAVPPLDEPPALGLAWREPLRAVRYSFLSGARYDLDATAPRAPPA